MNSYTLPQLPEEFLEIIVIENKDVDCTEEFYEVPPFANSLVFSRTNILTSTRLTHGDDVKEVYLIELPSYNKLYQPGDTIGIIPYNSPENLSRLFKQLKMMYLIHKKCKVIQNNENIKLKNKPVFLDKVTTIYKIFRNCIDIQCIPKKPLIRLMAEYTKDSIEKKVLEDFCSKEGSTTYEKEILENNKTFIDVLTDFPSCCPPVARLLENLPVLSPRPYSIASSPLASQDKLKIVFSVVKYEVNGRIKEGICTGMLKSILREMKNGLNEDLNFRMFYRISHGFSLPTDDLTPLILIGPGTGIAPFMGFLEHRKIQKSKGFIWLFYGCRFQSKDFLFKKELQDYLESGTLTKLTVSYSREERDDVRYVQDNIIKFGKNICDMLFDANATVFVCGDGRSVRKDVMNSFIDVIQQHRELDSKEAAHYIKNLQKEKRYLQDVWS